VAKAPVGGAALDPREAHLRSDRQLAYAFNQRQNDRVWGLDPDGDAVYASLLALIRLLMHRQPRLLVFALIMLLGGCFRSVEQEEDTKPGFPGGKCLAPDGQCIEGTCNRERNYCYDADDPCVGFHCGGIRRGFCSPNADDQPSCECEPGFENQTFSLYCCPKDEPERDPSCEPMMTGSSDSGESGG
jgi:hypothetical protein